MRPLPCSPLRTLTGGNSPLGYDPSDLDLESFALTVLRELREVVAHPAGESAPEAVLAALRAGAAHAAAEEREEREELREGEGAAREYGKEGWRQV